jgi:hypothetical protein
MYAIEFKVDISNNVIEIPKQYRDKMQTHVGDKNGNSILRKQNTNQINLRKMVSHH